MAGHHELSYDYKGLDSDPTALPAPTPSYVLNKYVGTYRCARSAEEEEQGIEAREVKIELRRRMLYLVEGIVITKQAEKRVEELDKKKKGNAKPQTSTKNKVQGRASRVSKPKPKIATRMATTKATTSLAAAMASSRPSVKSSTTTTSSMPKQQTALSSPAQTTTTTTTPLFLNCNGVPKFRIGCATEEEEKLNEGLQAMGRLGPTGGLVSFDVRRGEVVGVRVGGKLFGRV